MNNRVILKLCCQSWDDMNLRVTVGDREYPFTIQAFYRCLPHEALRTEWIAQTVADQIWLLYDFKNNVDKEEFLESLPSFIRKHAFDS